MRKQLLVFFSAIKNLFKAMWRFNRLYFLYIFINGFAMALYTYSMILLPKTVLEMLENGIIDWQVLVLLFSGVIFGALLSGLMKLIYTPIGYYLRYNLLKAIMVKNLHMPLEQYENPDYLDYQRSAFGTVSGVDGLQGFFISLGDMVGAMGVILVSIGILFQVHYSLAILTFIWIVVFMMLKINSSDDLDQYFLNHQHVYRETEYLNDMISDVSYAKEVRVFNLKPYFRNKREKLRLETKERALYQAKKISALAKLDTLYQYVRDGLMYIFLIIMYFVKGLTIAEFSGFTSLIAQLNQAFVLFIEGFNVITFRYPSYSRLFEILDDSHASIKNEALSPYDDFEIVFENVSFHYSGTTRYILKDLNFKIKKGSKLAIIGLNGVGKTTMMKLLMGLYAPVSGRILFNGQDIQSIDKNDYYQLFAPVFQELNLFPYSLKENLCFNQEVDTEELIEILKQVGLHDELKEAGLDQVMTRFIDPNGTLLSGGQSQKLLMARAMAFHRDILVLDEPTSALDAVAEFEFYNKINHELNDKTILFISHRLASTSFCDQILLVDDQNIAEYGTHDDLMAKKGKYYDLFNIQSKYYKEEVNYD